MHKKTLIYMLLGIFIIFLALFVSAVNLEDIGATLPIPPGGDSSDSPDTAVEPTAPTGGSGGGGGGGGGGSGSDVVEVQTFSPDNVVVPQTDTLTEARVSQLISQAINSLRNEFNSKSITKDQVTGLIAANTVSRDEIESMFKEKFSFTSYLIPIYLLISILFASVIAVFIFVFKQSHSVSSNLQQRTNNQNFRTFQQSTQQTFQQPVQQSQPAQVQQPQFQQVQTQSQPTQFQQSQPVQYAEQSQPDNSIEQLSQNINEMSSQSFQPTIKEMNVRRGPDFDALVSYISQVIQNPNVDILQFKNIILQKGWSNEEVEEAFRLSRGE